MRPCFKILLRHSLCIGEMSCPTGGTTTTANACPGPFLLVAARPTKVWCSQRLKSARGVAEIHTMNTAAKNLDLVACGRRHLKYPYFAHVLSEDGRMRCYRSSLATLRQHQCLVGENRFPYLQEPAQSPAGRSRHLTSKGDTLHRCRALGRVSPSFFTA
ncbi:hypothetical protein MRX96_043962 [Rhipicephalus microplus]